MIDISQYLTKTNDKGDFVEFCLYDYFMSKGLNVKLIKTTTGNQRFTDRYDIVVPDLLIQNNFKEIFFVESKSFWRFEYSGFDLSEFHIPIETMASYIKFYNEIFPNNKLEEYAEVYICFADVVYNEIYNGCVYLYFVPIKKLFSLDYREGLNHHKKNSYFWDATDIKRCKHVKVDFKFDNRTTTFYSKFSSNIMKDYRETLKISTNSVRKIIEDWENQTWSWS